MNCPNKRFIFDYAKAEEGPEILDILEENDFKGHIALCYTRRPNPYYSFMLEGKDTAVLICRDTQENKIAGVGACTVRQLYVNGEETEVAYLFGLRLRKEYRGMYRILPEGYSQINRLFSRKDIRYFVTTILEENTYAQRILEKKRTFMPEYVPLTRYGTFVIKTISRSKPVGGYKLRFAKSEDIPAILDFINRQGKKSQFYPVLDSECLSGKIYPGLNIEKFLILYDSKNNITACGAVWDQSDYKQYILKGYGGALKILYPLSAVFKLFGYPPLPKPGSMLEFFTLSFWAVKENNAGIFKTFIQLISQYVKGYPYFILGLSSENPLIQTIRELSPIAYWSRAYLVDWEKDGKAAELDGSLPVYLECGLL